MVSGSRTQNGPRQRRAAPSERSLVAIVGAPNVGKSTLFNRLIRRRQAIVTAEPGVTRDRLYGVVERGPRRFRLVDTGGLTPGLDAPFAAEIRAQVEVALREADAVVFVVDVRSGTTPLDLDIAALLRRRAPSVVLAVNKVDGPGQEPDVPAWHGLGFGEPVPISAEHAIGLDVLLERIHTTLGTEDVPGEPEDVPRAVSVALVGRPNVGKSSLLNRLAGEERATVSEVSGTTRDSVDTLLAVEGKRYLLVDTAGIRRKGRLKRGAESLAVLRAHTAIERSDVVVLAVDATEPLSAQDTHIAGYARGAHKPMLVVINKWDRVAERETAAKRWEREIRERFRFAREAPILLVSALTGQRVGNILDRVDGLHAAAGRKVPTVRLNRWLRDAVGTARTASAGGRKIRLFYGTQTGTHPPRFLLFCNDARRVHFSLRRRLENSLRETFDLASVPIVLRFRSRRESS